MASVFAASSAFHARYYGFGEQGVRFRDMDTFLFSIVGDRLIDVTRDSKDAQ